LANIQDKKTVPEIEQRLRDPAQEVRAEACKSLGRLRSKTSQDFLVECLADRDLHVRREAAGLGAFKNHYGRDALIAALEKSPYPDVRFQSAQELSAFSGEAVVSALVKATQAMTLNCVRGRAQSGEIGDSTARPRLENWPASEIGLCGKKRRKH